jgi:hypothetical protein
MDLFDAFDELTVMRTMAGQTVERGSLDGSLALLTSYDVSLVHHPPAEVMREVPPISSHNADVVRQYLDALTLAEMDAHAFAAWVDASVPDPPAEDCLHCGGDGCAVTSGNPEGCAWTRYRAPRPVSVYGTVVNAGCLHAATAFLDLGGRVRAGVWDLTLILRGEGWTYVLRGMRQGVTPMRFWPEAEDATARLRATVLS